MELVSPSHFANECLFASSKLIVESIVPIYEKKKNKTKILGSSVYVEVDGSYFLVTASHVVENYPRVYEDPELVPKYSEQAFVGYSELVDVAVNPLNGKLNKYKPIPLSRTQDFDNLPRSGRFFCTGYPSSKSNEYHQTLTTTVISIFTGGLVSFDAGRLKLSEDHCFGLLYPTKGLLGDHGIPTNQVDTHGMSGGGVFWVPDRVAVEIVQPLLVGILIVHDQKDSKTLIGTKFEAVKPLLSNVSHTGS